MMKWTILFLSLAIFEAYGMPQNGGEEKGKIIQLNAILFTTSHVKSFRGIQ